jgi:hypothetical protein
MYLLMCCQFLKRLIFIAVSIADSTVIEKAVSLDVEKSWQDNVHIDISVAILSLVFHGARLFMGFGSLHVLYLIFK